MKENNQKLTYQEIAKGIKCPLNGLPCRKNERVKTYEQRIEHDTIIYVAQCSYCGKKAMEWGYDQFTSPNDLTLKPKDL